MTSAKIFWISSLLLLLTQGCAQFHRHPKAENIEKDGTSQPLKQDSEPPFNKEQDSLGKRAFERAKESFDKKDYKNSTELFKGLFVDYPGFRSSDDAQFMYGLSLFHIGKYEEALVPLKKVIEATSNMSVYGYALLNYSENLIQLNRFDEALAATFQVAPDADLQNKLGVNPLTFTRKQKTTLLSHRVKAFLLRGRILTLIDSPYAKESLSKGKRLFNDALGFGIPVTESAPLQGEMGLRELEILNISCNRVPVPQTTTEETILNYLATYYKCMENAKVYLCDVERAGKTPFNAQTRSIYKTMVFFPLTLKDHLPPPGRPLKEEAIRQNFEADIKTLIDKKVDAYSLDFKNVEECNLSQIF